MPDIRMLNLDLFQIDTEIQTREVLDYGPLDLFRELYREDGPEALPPVVVFHDEDDTFWLADGHYRVRAAREALSKDGPRVLPADVREGTKREAILYAAGANAKHGQPLAAHEKQTVVGRLLKDPEWAQWSDRRIARHTGTSHVFVGGMRKRLELESTASGNNYQITASNRTVQRGGTTYQMDTGNIGRGSGSQPITTMTPASISATQDEDETDDGLETTVTKGLGELMQAWRQANGAARRTFRQWVLAQPDDDYGPITISSKDTKRNSVRIAEVCRADVIA